jgi:DNA-binding CsgD family transcriptional regulator/tetratricopeptide (TPR) repeat protein
VLIHGEAGVGKTSLLTSVCDEVRSEGVQVLWGQCLRFGTVEAMYHPLVLALEAWLGEADDEERTSVVEAVPGAALILPSLGALPADRPSMLMTVVDALLSRVIARRPTVLVIDDVQWADPATWDALSFLVAGFARQRMALLTTHRDEAASSELFQHWRGNVRRLPGTEELGLTRLDHDATSDQVAILLGRPPEPRLVQQVFEKSRGNPYFSELLVRRGDLGSSELPDDLPDELSQALLDAWRGLSAAARETTRILAIAGRSTDLRTLMAIAADLGVTDAGSLREAVDAGVLVLGGGEGVWFRHPLLARVLAESYLPGEAAPVHAAWGAHLESFSAEGVDELRRLGDIATHCEHAGDGVAAFTALLRAADLAEQLGARREAADLLVRAADLWEVAADVSDDLSRARLLERAGEACWWVGRAQQGYRLHRAALDLVSPEHDPLWASRLTRAVASAGYGLRERPDAIEDERRAVELSRADPDSGEHAEALAQLADRLYWDGRTEEGRQVVDGAVAAAHRSRSAGAISCAHGSRAFQYLLDTDLERAARELDVAWEHALASGDPDYIAECYHGRLNLLYAEGDLARLLEHVREWYQWSIGPGWTWHPAVMLAGVLLAAGELNEAEGLVRAGLGSSGWPRFEVMSRLQAATLAARRGTNDAALHHLLRARELLPDLETRPEVTAGAPMAEVLLAQHDPVGAFELVERVLPLNAVDPRVVDELMVLGARAAADLVQRASDGRDQTAVRAHRESLTRLVKSRSTLPGILFQPSCPVDTLQPARAALFAAESSRADGVEDQVSPWREAVAACATAGLGWEQQVATWRLASALMQPGAPSPEAAELLRGVHDYAVQHSATPLQTRVEELAASARISLAAPLLPVAEAVPAAFTGLTAREIEVLPLLVANRTNAEIARTLSISEKTASVHVSNLLRKTETRSRREVAALARRVGWGIGG